MGERCTLALPAAQISGIGGHVTGTLNTTVQALLVVQADGVEVRFKSGTGPIFVQAYPYTTTIRTGDAAPSATGQDLVQGDTFHVPSPLPGTPFWVLVWWGTVGDEIVTATGTR